MWWAVCRKCDFTAARVTRSEAGDVLVAHVEETGPTGWSITPMASAASAPPTDKEH
jgi:hypothetical protein